MSELQREERYIVVKRSHFHTEADEQALRQWLDKFRVPTIECVVVEADWPIYDIVWHLVERLATGQKLPYMTDEDPDKLADERDALAARLERHSMDAGHAEQRRAESRAVREALGFGADADDVSPRDLLDALDRLKAEWQAEDAFAMWLEEELKRDQLYINFSTLLKRYRRQTEGGEYE